MPGGEDELEKLRRLVELAADERTPEHEAVAAARAACRRLKRSGVLEAVEARRGTRGARARGGEAVLEGPFVVILDATSMYRLGRVRPPKRATEEVVCVPKEYVRDVVHVDAEDVKRMGWGGARMIRRIVVERVYVDVARAMGWYPAS